jgi:hypothetical protein
MEHRRAPGLRPGHHLVRLAWTGFDDAVLLAALAVREESLLAWR